MSGMSGYRWKITRDRIADCTRPEGTNCNAKGMEGPRDADDSITSNPTRFSLYASDECYYEGMLYGDFDGSEPLEDFGMPNAGCNSTKIAGKWL